jgi:hypothetical protein
MGCSASTAAKAAVVNEPNPRDKSKLMGTCFFYNKDATLTDRGWVYLILSHPSRLVSC